MMQYDDRIITIPTWMASHGWSPNSAGCRRMIIGPSAACGRIQRRVKLRLTVEGKLHQAEATHQLFHAADRGVGVAGAVALDQGMA
jgi:hypothetical protein